MSKLLYNTNGTHSLGDGGYGHGHSPTPDLKAHAVQLQEFLCALFAQADVVHIFARLSDERVEYYKAHPHTLPHQIAGKPTGWSETIQTDDDACDLYDIWMPFRMVSLCTRRAGSTSTKTLPMLHEFNRHGYDIHFCTNPLMGSKRCQRAVILAKHLLIECDHDTLERQRQVLDAYHGSLSALLYTGGKSIHAYVNLTPPLWNPFKAKDWKGLSRLDIDKDEGRANWFDFNQLALHWKKVMAAYGLTVDSKIMDCSALSRLPGFIHSGSGKLSEMLWVNPDAEWNPNVVLNPNSLSDESDVPPEPSLEDEQIHFAEMEDRLRVLEERDWKDEDGGDKAVVGECVLVAPVGASGAKDAREGEGEGGDSVKTNVPCTKSTNSTNPLRDVEFYHSLLKHGLPARHTRRDLHKCVFTVARLLHQDHEWIGTTWQKIIQNAPQNTIESPENAVKDILAEWDSLKSKPYEIWMPDFTGLPDLQEGAEKRLEHTLMGFGCPSPRNASRILCRLVYAAMMKLPLQCREGTYGLKSKDMDDICTSNRQDRKYSTAMGWLLEQGYLQCTNPNYKPREQTKQYRVNVLFVLHALGFREADLVWTKAVSQPASCDLINFGMIPKSEGLESTTVECPVVLQPAEEGMVEQCA